MSPPTKFDIFTYWLLNVSSAFMLSAAHNVFFHVFDIKTIVIHFMHYFFTFLFMFMHFSGWQMASAGVKIPAKYLKQTLTAPVVSQICVTVVTAWVHNQNRNGSLYLLRLCDFITTLFVVKYSVNFIGYQGPKCRNSWKILLPVAIFGSLVWLEFGHIEYDKTALLLAPFLGILRGYNILILKKSFKNFTTVCPQYSFEIFTFYYTGLITALLAIPALISYSFSVVPYDASWESIDYILVAMSFIFMVGFKFSELWLIQHIEAAQFCVLEHTKFFMASIGQWWLQNMAHATIYAFLGKIMFVTSSIRYWNHTMENSVEFYKETK